MRSLEISVPPANEDLKYPIKIGVGILQDALNSVVDWDRFSKAVLVSDRTIADLHLPAVSEAVPLELETILVPCGEACKDFSSLEMLWRELAKLNCDRSALLLNLGGGSLCDLAAFAAATYLRGISFIQLPTTLLAQFDACIGNKCGINLDHLKNRIGVFVAPLAVVMDTSLLESLSDRDYYAGFAELVKHACITESGLFEKLEELPSGRLGAIDLVDLVYQSCHIKAQIVTADIREQGPRKVLNFGHTFGHAIETLSHKGTPLVHGEAIAIGMLLAAKLSEISGRISSTEVGRLKRLLEKFSLPTQVPTEFKFEAVYQLCKTDKKNRSGKINWTLLESLGDASFDNLLEESLVKKAFESI